MAARCHQAGWYGPGRGFFVPGPAAFWLERQWANMLRLRQEGCPVVGFTWYSLTDQVDWDIDLREQHDHVSANGLYDMDRRIRRAGVEYRRIIREWSGALADRDSGTCAPAWLAAGR